MPTITREWREHPYYQFDPLADAVQPALLNSCDIKRYVDKECLIENFDLDRLKTASYEMRLLGTLHDWYMKDERLKPRCRKVCECKNVTLFKNSITYLWMKERLLLPEYIAARFNLHIRHVHKGILLGTGPLVDPGFGGNLLIPLHNLTDNDYELRGGEGVIWVEFTKLSRNNFWEDEDPERPRPYHLKSFPKGKNLNQPNLYFDKSDVCKAGGVQSAYKGALDRAEKHAKNAREEAKNAREEAERIKNRIRNIGIIALITIAVSIAGFLFSGFNMINNVTKIAQDSHNSISRSLIKEQNKRIKKLEVQIEELINQNKTKKD